MARKAITIHLKSAIQSGFDFIKRRFESVDELNDNFHAQRKWIFEKLDRKQDYKRRLAKVLEVVKMFACKFIGFCYLSENRLVAEYQKRHNESISKRTVGTCIKNLREIGFVTTIATKREDGKQTANIIVIEKLGAAGGEGSRKSSDSAAGKGSSRKDPEPAARGKSPNANVKLAERGDSSKKLAHKGEGNLRTNKTTSSFKTSLEEHKERMAKERRLLNFVPKWFKEQIACCATGGKEVHEYWKVAKHLMKRTFGSLMGADEQQAVTRAAIREFFLSSKASARGKFRMRNPFGFFHTVLETEAYAHVRRETQASSLLLYNWLED